MFVGLGTVINVLAILLGSALGIYAGAKFREETRDLVTTVLGFVTLLAAGDAIKQLWNRDFTNQLPKGWAVLTILTALLLGALIGNALGIEKSLEKLG
ncbi:MAG: DUF554 family protein, partial [Actinobacteria bacterium]|nr:DUF554 family protein [Actinomycetota bacterium]